MDVQLFWKDSAHSADIKVDAGDLVVGNDIQTAVIVSLFTDRRAERDDDVPEGMSLRGWWGDALGAVGPGRRIGSRLWLLGREKQLPEVLARAREYAEEALAWLVKDGVASAVQVQATSNGKGRLELAVTISRPRQRDIAYRFGFAWSQP